jgi:hypothetical protein
VSQAAGSATLLRTNTNQGGSFSITGPPDLGAPAAPTASQSGALAITQYNFVQSFVGISSQRWDGTNLTTGSKDGTLRVCTAGVFEMDCAASSSFNPGDLVGPAKDTGNALLPQTVVAVANKFLAIGRVEKAVASVSKVKVRLMTSKFALVSQI